jgi:transcriptional regulator of arginine metabolism
MLCRMTPVEERRAALRSLLREGSARTQAELLSGLKREGFASTQPVLSRDLKAVGAGKQEGRYVLPEEERINPLSALRALLRGATVCGANLVVVSCEPGAASAIARALEADPAPGTVGTVAGDDTVFVAVSSLAAGRRLQRRVRELL